MRSRHDDWRVPSETRTDRRIIRHRRADVAVDSKVSRPVVERLTNESSAADNTCHRT